MHVLCLEALHNNRHLKNEWSKQCLWISQAMPMNVPLLLHEILATGKVIRGIENLTCIYKITSREQKGSKEKKNELGSEKYV